MVEMKRCESPRNEQEDVGGMTNLAGIADEDFKAAGESSAPTEESAPENAEISFDEDAILDDPATIDVIGEKKDVSHEPGKVTKEILEVSPNFFREISSVKDNFLTFCFSTLDGRRKKKTYAWLAM